MTIKFSPPLSILLLALLAGSAQANGTEPPAAAVPAPEIAPAKTPEASLVDMIEALSKFLTEEETQLVYDYLWDSSIASLKGEEEEISLPPELAFKLAILQRRIVKEGGFYLEGLARRMEKDLANWQKNLLTPPPPPVYNLPYERNQAAPPATKP